MVPKFFVVLAMAVFSSIASFWTLNDPKSIVVHVGNEEYITVDEIVLCARF